MLLNLVLIGVLTLTGTARGQVFGPGTCPTYQTSEKFTVEKVAEMLNQDGLIPYLSAGTLTERYQSCQYLQLHDGSKFAYTYRDSDNNQHSLTGSYEVIPSSFKQPGYLRLYVGQPDILGSDITGYVNLYPILIDDEKQIYVSCTSYGVFHSEYAYTFLRPGARRSGDVGDVQVELISRGIPLAEDLVTRDQTCFETDPIMRRRVPQFVANLKANGFETNLAEEVRLQGAQDNRDPETVNPQSVDPLAAIVNFVQRI